MRPPLDTAAADLAALRAVAALAQTYGAAAGSDPPTEHLDDRRAAVLDLLEAHLAGGRAHRAATEQPPAAARLPCRRRRRGSTPRPPRARRRGR